ncbi:MAG: flagellar protein FlaG [Betaproteobacteria bacterium]
MAEQLSAISGLMQGQLASIVGLSSRPALEKGVPVRIAQPSSTKEAGTASPEAVGSPEAALGLINAHIQQAGSEVRFQRDESTGQAVFKVVDSTNGKVLLQVPSEEMLAMARNLQAMASQQAAPGVLLNKEG